MMLINIHKIFEDAILEKNIDTLEKIFSSSDNRMDLIEEFSKKHSLSLLQDILLEFRSKGLIKDILFNCDLLISKKSKLKDTNKKYKMFKTKCIHLENIETNKIKYLQEDTFAKNKTKRVQ